MSSTSRPLSSHPAFRLVVALWFAALLGLGTWVMPAGVFERAVSATGFDQWLPSAAPPLGATARVTISVVAAMLGALLGLFVASRAAKGEGTGDDADRLETLDERPIEDVAPLEDSPRRRPLNIREDLAERPDEVADPVGEPDAEEPLTFEPFETQPEPDFGSFDDEQVDDPLPEDFAPFSAEDEPTASEEPEEHFEAGTWAPPQIDPDASLAELDARLDAALATFRAGRTDGVQADTIHDTAAADPRTSLRDALDKLSQVDRDR